MAQSNLTVAITADTAKLQAGMVIAQSAMSEYSKTLKALANDHRAAADDAKSGIELEIRKVAEQFVQAKASVNGYRQAQISAMGESGKFKEVANDAKGFGAALAQNRMAAMELEHSARAMADGLAAGIDPMRLLAMETPRIIQAFTELQNVNLIAVAGWGSLAVAIAGAVGTLGYFAVQAHEASEAARLLDASFQARNIQASREQLAEWIDLLKKVGDLSREDAEKVIRSFEGIRGATSEVINALINMLPSLSKAFGEDGPAAAQHFAAALSDLGGQGEKFLRELGATDDVVNQFQNALQTNRAEAFKIVLSEAAGTATRYAAATRDATIAHRSFMETLAIGEAGQGGNNADEIFEKAHIDEAAKRATASVEALGTALAKAGEIKGGASLESVRSQITAMKEDTDKTSRDILDIEVKTWRDRIAVGDLSGKELIEAQNALAEALTQQRRAAGTQAIEDTKLSIDRMKATQVEGGAATLDEGRAGRSGTACGGGTVMPTEIYRYKPFDPLNVRHRAEQAIEELLDLLDAIDAETAYLEEDDIDRGVEDDPHDIDDPAEESDDDSGAEDFNELVDEDGAEGALFVPLLPPFSWGA